MSPELSEYNFLCDVQPALAQKLGPADPFAEPWNRLFSTLYLAESAAAVRARALADHFHKTGDEIRREFYLDMAAEEEGHADLVRSIVGRFYDADDKTKDVYAGRRCRLPENIRYLEWLVIIHQVFEPSALAILSYLRKYADEYFESAWARQIKRVTARILREEAAHIRKGCQHILAERRCLLSEGIVRDLKISIRTHKRFIESGIYGIFDHSVFEQVAPALVSRLATSYSATQPGVFNAKATS